MSLVSFLFFLPTFLSPLVLIVLFAHSAILSVEVEHVKEEIKSLRSGREHEPFPPEYFALRQKVNTLKSAIIPLEVSLGIFLVFVIPCLSWVVVFYLAITALFNSTLFTGIRKYYSSMFLE